MTEDRREITYREINDGRIEICRDLCNALMAHQADCGRIHPEALRAMNFDNRLKPSFEKAAEKQVVVAMDGELPVGYIFSTAAMETEASKSARPDWAKGLSGADGSGFYPDSLPMPQKIGCLHNLYVLPEYRGRHIAYTLCGKAMAWFRNTADTQTVFVYISNGNDGVISLYRNLGFRFSHEVFGGFILAYSLNIRD
ncbi:MAG: GNAT family N-acetyltransferase [Bacillota bacterium]